MAVSLLARGRLNYSGARKNLLLSEEKLQRGSDVGDECVIRYIPAHKIKVAAVGMFLYVCKCVCAHSCVYMSVCMHVFPVCMHLILILRVKG